MKEQQKSNKEHRVIKQSSSRQERLRLPFDDSKRDSISWIYDNRRGLIVTVVILFVWAVVAVVAHVSTEVVKVQDTIYIELSSEDEVAANVEQQLESVSDNNSTERAGGRVQNQISNDEATLNEIKAEEARLERERAANAQADAKVQQDVAETREAYEAMLSQITMAEKAKRDAGQHENTKFENTKRDGNVTVRFSFTNPKRRGVLLPVPAYLCEDGGDVVVTVTLNQSGEVIKLKKISGGDDCMRQAAKDAAFNSRFDSNTSAPLEQQGTITYKFVAQ